MAQPELREDEIGRHLAEAERSGELRAAESWGKPMAEDEGWAQTPLALRLPFKILKDAGYRPPDIGLFHERAQLRAAVDAAASEAERTALMLRLSALEQKIALRLEGLRRAGTL